MRERYVVINGSINGKELSVSKKKNPERKLQTETHAVIGKAVRDFQNNRRTRMKCYTNVVTGVANKI